MKLFVFLVFLCGCDETANLISVDGGFAGVCSGMNWIECVNACPCGFDVVKTRT